MREYAGKDYRHMSESVGLDSVAVFILPRQ